MKRQIEKRIKELQKKRNDSRNYQERDFFKLEIDALKWVLGIKTNRRLWSHRPGAGGGLPF